MMSGSGIHFTYPAALAASRNPFCESGLHAATFVIDAITIILRFFFHSAIFKITILECH